MSLKPGRSSEICKATCYNCGFIWRLKKGWMYLLYLSLPYTLRVQKWCSLSWGHSSCSYILLSLVVIPILAQQMFSFLCMQTLVNQIDSPIMSHFAILNRHFLQCYQHWLFQGKCIDTWRLRQIAKLLFCFVKLFNGAKMHFRQTEWKKKPTLSVLIIDYFAVFQRSPCIP